MKYSLPVAYLLWFISGGGALGLHRFYLGKAGTGFLWLFTGGLAGVGCVYDLFTLPRQVKEANMKYELELAAASRGGAYLPGYDSAAGRGYAKPETPEKIILRIAKRNGGQVTPGEVAIESDITAENARKELDAMAAKGMAEMRVRSSGVIVYFFPEFSREKSDFVDLG